MAGEPVAFIGAMIDQDMTAADWISFGVLEPLFISEWEKGVWGFVAEYVRHYGKLPTKPILKAKFDDPFNASGDANYYHEELRKRFLEHSIRDGVQSISPFLQNDDAYDPDLAIQQLRDRLVSADLVTRSESIVDSRTAMPVVFQQYEAKSKMTAAEKGLLLGWPSVDVPSGGIEGGEVISIVGRPATGKTWFLLWCAMKGWEQGRRCLFVTLEMPAKQIIERQIGIAAGVDYAPIKTKTKLVGAHYDAVKAMIDQNSKVKIPFYVLDGRMASHIHEVEMVARSLGVDAIYSDGGYLFKHPDGGLNRYQRVAENMDLIKDCAIRMDVPWCASWQFGRSAATKFAKKNAEDPDLEDIGYTDAIGQHSSIILGLLQAENLATLKQRKINILKGRGGEHGTFAVAWDFMHCFFGEQAATVEADAIFLDGPVKNSAAH